MILQKIFAPLNNLLFPNNCELCHTPLLRNESSLCMSCIYKLPYCDAASYALIELKITGRFSFEKISSCMYFYKNSILQNLMHQIKYRQNKNLALNIGKIWGNHLWNSGILQHIDAIIPIPLHPKKEHKRGYNQSVLLAQSISEISGIPLLTQKLIRLKDTDTQTKKSRHERLENMKDVFVTKDESSLQHKHLLLIDDVLTTGATIEACSLELLKIEGVKISIATLAVAMD